MSSKKLARQKQLHNYKKKWGMLNYRFFSHSYANWSGSNHYLYVIHSDVHYVTCQTDRNVSVGISTKEIGKRIFEIQSLTTFLRKLSAPETRIFLCDNKNGYEVETLDGLKEIILIRKLAGV